MLVLTRLKEEAIMIGHDVEVKILDIRGDRVRLGIVAPPSVSVHRKEVYLAIQRENLEAARVEPAGLDEAVRLYGDQAGEGGSEPEAAPGGDDAGGGGRDQAGPRGPAPRRDR